MEGLITWQHNNFCHKWHCLYASALSPFAVTNKLQIFPSWATEAAAAVIPSELFHDKQGDVAAHRFWKKGQTAIFDICITNTDAHSNQKLKPDQVLARHEREKKYKYLHACLDRHHHFTLLVFLVDGLTGKEAYTAVKYASLLLSLKWDQPYSVVYGFVWLHLAIAIV